MEVTGKQSVWSVEILTVTLIDFRNAIFVRTRVSVRGTDTSQHFRTGHAATASTSPAGAEGVQDGISVYSHSHWIPGRGLSMEVKQLHQLTVSFHAPACGGHHCGTQ